MNTIQHVVVKPIITEKSLKDAQKGFFTFEVNQKANKTEIARAVGRLFNVKVIGISTNIVKGIRVRFTKKGRSVQNLGYKKARVTLTKGQKIDIFEEKTS